MSTTQREVRVEVYVNGDFYCGDSFWAVDEQDVQVEFQITDAIYDLIGTSQQVDVQLEVDAHDSYSVCYSASENIDVQLVDSGIQQDGINASSETAEEKNSTEDLGVPEDLIDPAKPSTEVAGSSSGISQEGMDASPEIPEENNPKAGLSTEEAGSSSGMDASPESPDENNPTESTKVRIMNKICAFLRKFFGISAQPKTDLAVPERMSVSEASASEPTYEKAQVDEELSSVPVPEPETELDQTDLEESSVPIQNVSEAEPTLDLDDPEGSNIPGPSSSELELVFSEGLEAEVNNLISELVSLISEDQTDPAGLSTEEAGSSSGMDASPETPDENDPRESTKVRKINKVSAFFQKLFGISAQPKMDPVVPELSSVSDDANTSEATFDMNFSDTEPSSIPVLGIPELEPEVDVPGSVSFELEPELDLVDPEGSSVPGRRCFDPGPVYSEGLDVGVNNGISEVKSPALASEDPAGRDSVIDQGGMDYPPETPEENDPTGSAKARTLKLKMSPKAFFQRLFSSSSQHEMDHTLGPSSGQPEVFSKDLISFKDYQLYKNVMKVDGRLNRCKLSLTPVTEVWTNVFLGDEETARDRAKLVEMGITHILNAAAPRKNLRSLVGMAKKKDLRGKICTGPKYYKGMNITYCGLPTTYQQYNIGKYFVPAAKFITEALTDPENKVLIHCRHGVSHSPTLFMAYLMMRYEMPLEEALDYVLKVRRIKPFTSFLLQLALIDPTPVKQQKKPQPGIKIYT